ncbi:cation-translocating P-type ATPase [Gillisia limnaea]|uniref:ATPase, P-type (Transporting), HAD superfamily, subfamily IC n=1 Tax=Gillisia limnaea (strain DSM 15749 / LMG 21470 / R-8282) TaxID=865937 RepID=H2BUK2_GILLR|nr:cation-translocating P-type ATPase [Gillisia limnaea]EHQ03880.1 ATPase, P-type (transporting), HAD superfamily, subfamily IC [Gillisia limnaea DSM 15749]
MWHTQSIQQVVEKLKTDVDRGLTTEEIQKRLEKYGLNKWREQKAKSIWLMFFAQLKDALIYVLLGAVVITLFMGEYVDSIIIMLVILINASLGVIQEVKAGKAIAELQKLASPKALVKRNGSIEEVSTEALVPGDIVILETGRLIPADLRLLETINMQIEESALTGESVPVHKNSQSTLKDENSALGDRINLAYMSTLVTYGRGLGVVIATGEETEVGKIAEDINTNESKTPLEKRLDELGKLLGKLAVGVCSLIFMIGYFQGREVTELFLTAVSLAVASIPEGLAAIVAVVLSIGVTKMSKRNAIIKRLPAVETLGAVNIICTDKTGTLTQNKMKVSAFFTPTTGTAKLQEYAQQPQVKLLAKAMVLCSDATLNADKSSGDPTEIALLQFADNLKLDRETWNKTHKRTNELPFDATRKMMSVAIKNPEEKNIYTKGAVDRLLPKCTQVLLGDKVVALEENQRSAIEESIQNMSSHALRTLAVAYKPITNIPPEENWEEDLIFIGLVGMIDPPRTEVKPAIAKAAKAGITTIMITGDHKETAFAIAKQLGIAQDKTQAITGQELDAFGEDELIQNITNYRIFARVSPQHKVIIVKALQAAGNTVSMTGDGVNDAPSLSHADIGVAMGITGTDVSKGASDMILADDNFSTIVTAVEQGRNIYNNIKKSVLFLLTSNIGEVITMLVCILAGMPTPLIATQLLWINLITDSLPAIALGMDPDSDDVMQHKPRPPKESFFAHKQGWRILFGGLVIGAITISAYWFGFYEHGYSPFDSSIPDEVLSYARTMAFMSIISAQLFYSLAFRHYRQSIFQLGLFSNKYLVAAIVLGFLLQLLVLEVPVLRKAFKLQLLDGPGWLMALGMGLVPLLLNELLKAYSRIKSK